jgi:hypothetical protein
MIPFRQDGCYPISNSITLAGGSLNTVRLSLPTPNSGGADFLKVPQNWGLSACGKQEKGVKGIA